MYDEMTAMHELANIENILIEAADSGLPDHIATMLLAIGVGKELGYLD